MPAGNGMGPQGMGPMTGRGMGFCAGVAAPGSMNTFPGRGIGMGFGRGRGACGGGRGNGRGWRNMFNATGLTGWPLMGAVSPDVAAPTREQELNALKGQAEYFESALDEIRKRLQELDAEKAEK